MQLAERAFRELFPEKRLRKSLSIRYSGRFKGYNATVTSNVTEIIFSLSRGFEETSDEIQIGVMQHLLNKLYKTRVETLEQELYGTFTKKLTEYAPVDHVDPVLKESFDRVNKIYFHDFMMTPNLKWGQYSLRTLGHYSFSIDTITISKALVEDQELLDYVMHHEMLHKKHKFDESPGGMTKTHTKAFREDEKKYKLKDAEKRLGVFIRSRKRPRREKPLIRKLLDYWS